MSRQGIDVATWLSCPGGRDLGMMSRPGLGLGKGEGGRDMRPRPGRYARDLRWLRVRHARDKLAVRAAAPTTWAVLAQCARDLGSGCAHCAPNPVL